MTSFTDIELPGMPPPDRYPARPLADALGIGHQRVLRWLARLGVQGPGMGGRAYVTHRQAVAILAAVRLVPGPGHRHGKPAYALARQAALNVARGDDAWLFVCPRWTLHAHDAERLLSAWRAFGSPTGTVLNCDRLSADVVEAWAARAAKVERRGIEPRDLVGF